LDSEPTNRQRVTELKEHARKTDPEVAVEEVFQLKDGAISWAETVKPFDSILYVSRESDLEKLRDLHAACWEEKKMFLPAVSFQQVGLAGPLVHPDFEGCWESAWRRIHQSAFHKDPQLEYNYSSTTDAMLANVIVFECFKKMTGVSDSEPNSQLFLFNLGTLEGKWHSFLPHPLVTGRAAVAWILDIELLLKQSSNKRENGLLAYFSRLTSLETGLFHIWEEGDLMQLPLAQCLVQAVDPLSEGPAGLLPEQICTGLTHEEARREAGLAGIEAYVSQLSGHLVSKLVAVQDVVGTRIELQEFIGIGTGETVAEGINRGLQKCLAEELGKQLAVQLPTVSPILLSSIDDERCQFYLQALTTMKGAPGIGLGEDVSGFPVLWVESDCWYGSIGLNVTLALRSALQQALLKEQNQTAFSTTPALETAAVKLKETAPINVAIPACASAEQSEVLQSAMQVLKHNRLRLLAFEIELESSFKEELAGVFGVLLREEEAR
jgi:putative thiazole-containing bacteriocin maturation protein